MESYSLHDSSISFSRLALGTWGFSGAKLWGDNDEKTSIQTIDMAFDNGITVFDTAERYGNGKAEEVLGKALKGKRDKAVICSKVRLAHYDEIISHCEESLKRLGTDYIDVYQVHWPFRDVPMEETLGAYEELKKSGKVREIGVCNFGPQCIGLAKEHKIVTNQLPYSLVWRIIEKNGTLEKSVESNMAIWAYVPLAQGLLTGKFKSIDDVPMNRRETRFYSSSWGVSRHTDTGFEKPLFETIGKLDELCSETGFSMIELAYGFLKANSYVSSILTGARDRSQLEMNIRAFEKEVPADVINEAVLITDPLKNIMGDNADLWENKDGGRMY